MSTATIEKIDTAPAAQSATSRVTAPARPTRVRRPGPGVGPAARPSRQAPAPSMRQVRPIAARSCTVELSAARRRSWHLTDRGVALVLVLAALIVTAAVVVVGLTAWRVTSPSYRSGTVTTVAAMHQS